MQSHHFPQASPDAIPHHGLAERPWRGKSNARARGRFRTSRQENRKQRRAKTPAGFINPVEVGTAE